MDSDFQAQLELEEKEKLKNECTYTDPSDGTQYEWDFVKKAWFPKLDEDFLAAYLMNYGENTDASTSSKQEDPEARRLADEKIPDDDDAIKDQPKCGDKRKPTENEGWFEVEDDHNTNVYVSELPLDTTEEEFVELMMKCGLIMKDPDTRKMKIKLYADSDGKLKGDGRCCYIKVESVKLALEILDGYNFKGNEIRVERAKFQMKGAFDPKKKPKKKRNRDKLKQKKIQEKLFDWRPDLPDGSRPKHEKTVILKNMFVPADFDKDAKLILEYQQDIRDECMKCGEVRKVKVYDRHDDGVVSVAFKEREEADKCLALMNRRWFGGRQLTAEMWDGKTKYTIEETEEELEARIKKWDEFLEEDENAS